MPTLDHPIDSLIAKLSSYSGEPAQLQQQLDFLHNTAAANDSLYTYLNGLKTVGTKLRKAGELGAALQVLEAALPDRLWRVPQTPRERSKAVWTYVQLAFLQGDFLGDFSAAKDHYELALTYVDDSQENPSTVAQHIWKPLGSIYTRVGEMAAAETRLKACLPLTSSTVQAQVYNDLGILYESWQKTTAAETAFLTGLALDEIAPKDEVVLYLSYASWLIDTERFTEAQRQLQLAQTLLDRLVRNGQELARQAQFNNAIQRSKASIALSNKDYALALDYLEQAQLQLLAQYPSGKHRSIGKLLVAKAEVLRELNRYPIAIVTLQQALATVIDDYQPLDEFELPKSSSFYAENTILEALDGMADVYEEWYLSKSDDFYLKQSLACYERAIVVEQALRRSYFYDSSKLYGQEESRLRSERAIAVAIQLKDAATAFAFAERSRSNLLREAFQASQAQEIAGVSADDLSREDALQRAVGVAEKELFSLRSSGMPDSLLFPARQALIQAREALQAHIETLEQRYPRYYQFKYDDQLPDQSQLASMLASDELLIEYFVGEHNLAVFTLTAQGDLAVQSVAIPADLDQRVVAWRQNIENYAQTGVDLAALKAAYQVEAQALYEELLAPILTLHTSTSRLLIITSGILDLLPFEALLTAAVSPETPWSAHPFLLRDQAVRYGYSAGLQWSLQQLPQVGDGWGGFAPTFTGEQSWPALSCSATVLDQVFARQAKLHTGNDATIAVFEATAPSRSLLHLATHAQANPAEGDFSFIVFSDGVGGYDSLYAKDLYQYDLQAELVLLSACETALGTLYNSEGVISLARSFHYAGARSVMTTLWSINENANCSLLENLYTQLKAGVDKSQALQSAKLALIDSDPLAGHPVYWAGFQLMGNDRSLESSTLLGWMLGGGLMVLIGAFIWVNWRKRRKLDELTIQQV